MEAEEEAPASPTEGDSLAFSDVGKVHMGKDVVDRKFGWVGMFMSCSARSLSCTAGSSDCSVAAMKSNFERFTLKRDGPAKTILFS